MPAVGAAFGRRRSGRPSGARTRPPNQKHAEAERVRRRRVTSSPQAPKLAEIAAARGHAAKIFSPTPMCDRPGCHEPVEKSGRNQARYCCEACREAVRRVVDRERKCSSVALSAAGAHASRSTKPHERGGATSNTTQPVWRHHRRRLRDPEHKPRRSAVDSLARQAAYLGTEWSDSIFAPQEFQACT